MSNEIYYDQAYVKVGNQYIPIVNQGSSNTYTFYNGRKVAERYWNVLNYRTPLKLLFTLEELRDVASDFERISQESGGCYRTRYTQFGAGEFERWILGGIKSAHTIPEYCSYGNTLILKHWLSTGKSSSHPVTSEENLMKLLEEAKQSNTIRMDMRFEYARGVYRPVKRRVRSENNNKPETYYAIWDSNKQRYLKRLHRTDSLWVSLPDDAHRFRSHWEAERYMERYQKRLPSTCTVRFMDKQLTPQW